MATAHGGVKPERRSTTPATIPAASGVRHDAQKRPSRVLKNQTMASATKAEATRTRATTGSVIQASGVRGRVSGMGGRTRSCLDSDLRKANRVPGEIPSRSFDVKVNLVVQLQRRAELLLAPQQLVEVEPHDVAVDVGVEIEDVALDGQGVIFVQRRT